MGDRVLPKIAEFMARRRCVHAHKMDEGAVWMVCQGLYAHAPFFLNLAGVCGNSTHRQHKQ